MASTRGAQCVAAANCRSPSAPPSITREGKPTKHRSLLSSHPAPKSRQKAEEDHVLFSCAGVAAGKISSPSGGPPRKRLRRPSPVKPGQHDRICISEDEDVAAEADNGSSPDHCASPHSAPDVAKLRAASSDAKSGGSTSRLVSDGLALETFHVEKVCIGILPGVVVGAVTVEDECPNRTQAVFRMTVSSEDFPIRLPLDLVTSWEYGCDKESRTYLLRLLLTPAARSKLQVRCTMFTKQILNPEAGEDLLKYVSFFLTAPLSISKLRHLQSLVDACNSKMATETWKDLSAEAVVEISSELNSCAAKALKIVENSSRENGQATAASFYSSGRQTRPSTRSKTIATLQECSFSKSSSSKVSSGLPSDYKKPTPENNPKQLITYPPRPEPGGITVTSNDLLCLQPQEFLNDIIIDFYLKYLFHNLSPERKKKVYMFNSFFYPRLTQAPGVGPRSKPGRTATDQEGRTEMHERVKKWTRNVDIFEKDFVFIPINEHAHWFLAVICFPGMEHPVTYDDAVKSEAAPPVNSMNSTGTSTHTVESTSQDSCSSTASTSSGSDSSPHQVDGEEAMLDDDGCDQEQENVLSEEEEEKECFENSDVSPNHFSLNGSPQPDSTTSGSQCATPQRTEQSDDAGYGRLADDGAAIYITDSSCSLSCASLVPSGKLPLLLDEAVVQRSFGDPAPMTAGEVTVDKSLGRSIALGIDSVRDAMDTAMFSTCSKEDEPDGQPISEWPISSNHSKEASAGKKRTPMRKSSLKHKGKGKRLPITRPRSRTAPQRLKSQPCILLFDSLGGRHRSRIMSNLKSYLTEEWKAKRNSERVFDSSTMKSSYPKVPEQNNFCDCGIFVLQYVESILKDAITNYSLPMDLRDMFEMKTVLGKRQAIIDLIGTLAVEREVGDKKTGCAG